MSQKGKSMMDAAASMRLVYGPYAAKKISRRFGIAVRTAKKWLTGQTPTDRELEIAHALIAECDRLEALIAETRSRWQGVVDESSQTSRSVARRAPH